MPWKLFSNTIPKSNGYIITDKNNVYVKFKLGTELGT